MIDAKEREILNSGMKVIWIIWGALKGENFGDYYMRKNNEQGKDGYAEWQLLEEK